MSETTIYRVLTVYDVQNNSASRGLGEVEKAARSAAKATQDLTGLLKGVGMAFVGSSIFSGLKNAFIGYNQGIEDAKVKIGGLLAMFSHAPIDTAMDRAAISVSRFEKMASKSALTTKDLVNTYAGIVRPLQQAGISITQQEQIAFGVANAAKALGGDPGMVQRDVAQALSVKLTTKDQFMVNMLAQQDVKALGGGKGLSIEKYNSMSKDKKVEALTAALTSPKITQMAEKQANTMSGVLSTLEDNFQIMMGRIGLPLFKALTEEIKGWNNWLDKNQKKVDEIAKSVAHGLVTAFSVVKDVFAFIWKHADTLIMVAKAYAAIKVGSMLGNALGNSAGNAAGGMGRFAAWFSATGGGGRGPSDSFGPDGTYQYTPGSTKAGRGRQAVGGMKGALANADLIGGAAAAGYALGHFANETLGLSDMLSGTVKMNGETLDVTDRMTRKYVALEVTMAKFDKTVQGVVDSWAKHKLQGAAGSEHVAKLAGREKYLDEQIKKIEDTIAVNAQMSGVKGGLDKNGALAGTEFLHDTLLHDMGGLFDEKEKKRIRFDPEGFLADLKKQRNTTDTIREGATKTADEALKSMPKALQTNAAVMKALMEYILQNKRSGGHLAAGEIAEIIAIAKQADASIDAPFEGAKSPSTTVNITIQRVMAKDPNRWLADMDDMVSRRTRAKTRAKNGWKNTPH